MSSAKLPEHTHHAERIGQNRQTRTECERDSRRVLNGDGDAQLDATLIVRRDAERWAHVAIAAHSR